MAHRIILGCACLVVALIALFPPMRNMERENAYGDPEPTRGHLLSNNFYRRTTVQRSWENGQFKEHTAVSYQTLDTRRLVLELLLSAAVTGGAIAMASAIHLGRSANYKDRGIAITARAA